MVIESQVEYIGLFSGGKDSLTVCHKWWIEHGKKPFTVLYCRTGVGLNEEYVTSICKKYNWTLVIVEPKSGETFEDFVEKYGFPHQGMHNSIFGCLKGHPIRKWHNEQKKLGRNIIFLSGRRKKESKRRMRMKSNKEMANFDGMMFYSYIYNMTTPEVWGYLNENKLERSPTYETMHLSGDCLCGAFSSKGESDWLSVFHPEMAKRFMELEKKYGSKWGNQISITDMSKQQKMESWLDTNKIDKNLVPGEEFVCSECEPEVDE